MTGPRLPTGRIIHIGTFMEKNWFTLYPICGGTTGIVITAAAFILVPPKEGELVCEACMTHEDYPLLILSEVG